MVILEYNKFLDSLQINFTGKFYTSNVYYCFIKNNKIHRYYGPAEIWSNNEKSWFINNKCYGYLDSNYNYKKFIKDLSKSWLL